jgi:hypothetical protein
MNVPKDLQPYVQKIELRWSLNTGYISAAKRKARVLAVAVQDLFQAARETMAMGELPDDEIRQIVHQHIHEMLKVAEYLGTENLPGETQKTLFHFFKEAYDHFGQSAKRDLVDCSYTEVYSYVRAMITGIC